MWGKNMNLPTDLIHAPANVGKSNPSGYVKNLGKELREIRKRMAPFNQAAKRPLANPFKEGDLILIYQQQMEKTHKLPPRWRGPFSIVKIPNSFQVIYLDEGRKKIMHASNCKKFQEKIVTVGKEAPPPGDAIPKQKKSVNWIKGHNAPSHCPRMTVCCFEVCFRDVTRSFVGPDLFLLWLQDQEDASNDDVYLRGVPARGEVGSQEVTTFFRKLLRLAPTLVHWQQRTLRYLRNRCRRRFCEEGAVCQACQEDSAGDNESREEELVSPADDITKVMTLVPGPPVMSVLCHRLGLEGINTGPASQGDTSVGSLILLRLLSLQTSQLQQQHPASSKSPPLSLFEQKAIRTCGHP